jgi:peptidoglycan hydrolase-like protein with peptidoglycan-binding domain
VAVTCAVIISASGAVATPADAVDAHDVPLSWSTDAPLLGIGSTGDAVRVWQAAMNNWLEVTAPVDQFRLVEDGDYGRLTDSITRRFQFAQGLPVDGLVGPVTRAAYLSAPELVEARRTPVAHTPSLGVGDRGDGVAAWQSALDSWLAAAGARDRQIAVDGIFGPDTEAATRFFQHSQGVHVDGLVGPETRAALVSAPALVNAAPAAPDAPDAPDAPAAGICPAVDAAIVELALEPDAPAPRCVTMSGEQWIRIVNDGAATHVALGPLELDLEPGETSISPLPVGAYVDTGLHTLAVSRFGGSGPELQVR